MNKQHILTAAASLSVAAILLIGSTTAYFTDIEVKDNIITIGKIDLQLDEGNFPSGAVSVVPGTKQEKAPKLINTGTKDEFVFLKITVPKANITLLNNFGTPDTHYSGTKPQQLFRFITNNDSQRETLPIQENKDIDFSYHYGNSNGTELIGWILIESDEQNAKYDEYVFAYNKKLSPNETSGTCTLFDAVQLKSFIDGEASGTVSIGVYGFGIQADNLKATISEPSGTVDTSKTMYSTAELRAIYEIVKNKYEAKKSSNYSVPMPTIYCIVIHFLSKYSSCWTNEFDDI